MRRLILLSLSVFVLVSAARADDIYNNLSTAKVSTDPVSSFGPLADSFSTGASTFSLDDLTLKISADPTSGGSFHAYLMSDNSTSPGAILATFATINDSSLTSIPSLYTYSLSSPYLLSANTRYWIELSGANTTADWAWPGDPAGVGVAGEFFWNQGGGGSAIPNDNGPYQMKLSSTPAVPEPSSLLLLGTGALSAFAAFRRKFIK